jgi:hypothetical protein
LFDRAIAMSSSVIIDMPLVSLPIIIVPELG